jgi:hypothetical protein
MVGCHQPVSIKAKRLADTLAKLRKLSDFRPLDQEEAYAFMNRYYLPRLDSLPTKRKIFIHPLTGVDFKELFIEDSVKLQKEYEADSTHKVSNAAFIRPPSLNLDQKFNWDNKKLINAVVIKPYTTNSASENSLYNTNNIKAWHRRYGYAYMCVSYPQYNPYTKYLLVREWVENEDFCENCIESKFWFVKTPSGWKGDSFRWNISQYKTENP